MKTLKISVLLLTTLIINSCTDKGDCIGCNAPHYQHLLWLSFQDESGNDLLEGSEFVWSSNYGMADTGKPEFYALDIFHEDRIIVPGDYYSRLYLAKGWLSPPKDYATPDYNYLWFDTYSSRIVDEYFAKKVTLRLACPYLFGDNETHDIVTWWEPIIGTTRATCYRIEYGGKEFPVSEESIATIILDR